MPKQHLIISLLAGTNLALLSVAGCSPTESPDSQAEKTPAEIDEVIASFNTALETEMTRFDALAGNLMVAAK